MLSISCTHQSGDSNVLFTFIAQQIIADVDDTFIAGICKLLDFDVVLIVFNQDRRLIVFFAVSNTFVVARRIQNSFLLLGRSWRDGSSISIISRQCIGIASKNERGVAKCTFKASNARKLETVPKVLLSRFWYKKQHGFPLLASCYSI